MEVTHGDAVRTVSGAHLGMSSSQLRSMYGDRLITSNDGWRAGVNASGKSLWFSLGDSTVQWMSAQGHELDASLLDGQRTYGC